MKKILSVILMLTLLFSFAIPVFAEEQEMYSVQVKVHVDGEIKTKGSTLAKMLYTIEHNTEDYNCQFIFTKKSECGAKIIELLTHQ